MLLQTDLFYLISLEMRIIKKGFLVASDYCVIGEAAEFVSVQYVERILNQIEDTFNKTFAGLKSMHQGLKICLI